MYCLQFISLLALSSVYTWNPRLVKHTQLPPGTAPFSCLTVRSMKEFTFEGQQRLVIYLFTALSVSAGLHKRRVVSIKTNWLAAARSSALTHVQGSGATRPNMIYCHFSPVVLPIEKYCSYDMTRALLICFCRNYYYCFLFSHSDYLESDKINNKLKRSSKT